METLKDFNLFEISLVTLNVFSFMLGMTFAAFQSWYGRTAFKYIIAYFMLLAFYYWMKSQGYLNN